MERVASITSSYYKFSEAAILVFSLDNPDSFNVLSQHLLDVVTYAENANSDEFRIVSLNMIGVAYRLENEIRAYLWSVVCCNWFFCGD